MPARRTTKPKTIEVTFRLPAAVEANSVALCGDFNAWSTGDIPLDRDDDGCWQATVALRSGFEYRYKYLIDGQRWENAWEADGYVANPFGSEDSLIVVG